MRALRTLPLSLRLSLLAAVGIALAALLSVVLVTCPR